MAILFCSKVSKISLATLSVQLNKIVCIFKNLLLHLPGDLQNEESVLEWLIDDDNRELADEIESVNERMLERLLDESPFLAVFFCKYHRIW